MIEVYSPYLAAIVAGWVLGHGVKYLLDVLKGRKIDPLRELFISGGMPSSHTTAAVSLWTVILLKDGWTSGLFGLATLFALIVAYDAVKVRRSVGEHGRAITEVIAKTKVKVKAPYTAPGHRPIEVVVGALFGLVVGGLVYILTDSWTW